jgi:hypothetical protein
LEKAVVGGISVESMGIVWLAFGLTLSSEEIVRLLSSLWKEAASRFSSLWEEIANLLSLLWKETVNLLSFLSEELAYLITRLGGM